MVPFLDAYEESMSVKALVTVVSTRGLVHSLMSGK